MCFERADSDDWGRILGTGSDLTRTPQIRALFCLLCACRACDAEVPQAESNEPHIESISAWERSVRSLYDHPAFFLRGPTLASSPDKHSLIDALEGLEANPTLEVDDAIALQNDLWSLHNRAQNSDRSDPQLARVAELAGQLAYAIAPDDVREHAPPDALPDIVAQLGVVEVGTEMSVLTHEAFFGFRRVFRLAMNVDNTRRVLFSQIVAFDREGRVGVTDVVGEIEHLVFQDGSLIEARVWHRDPRHGLHEVDAVTHIPSLGANGFFLQEPDPIPLSTLPCTRCHEDDGMQSLPRADLAVRPRWDNLLNQALVPLVREQRVEE